MHIDYMYRAIKGTMNVIQTDIRFTCTIQQVLGVHDSCRSPPQIFPQNVQFLSN